MKLIEPILENLINLISRLPGLGPKSARRIALYLLKNKDQQEHDKNNLIVIIRSN